MKKHLYIILLILPLIGFGQGDIGYTSIQNGTLLKTTDSGNTWVEIISVNELYIGNTIENVSFVNETTGYITDWFSMWKTTDSGETWTLVSQVLDENGELDDFDDLIGRTSFINETDISTIELPTPTSKRELVKTTNILGQENTIIKNQPLIEIYDDGSVEKKYIID